MRGYLYVLSNSSMPGLLKVGYTVRSIEERINELSSTGVPTRFDLEFFCEVDNAFLLEKEIHREIKKNHHGKEFFKCNIATVVRVVKLTLINSNYVIYSAGGKSSSRYLTNDELENIRKEQEIKAKQALEIKKKEEEMRLVREAELIEFNKKKDYFFQTAINAEKIILKYTPVDKYEKIKDAAWMATWMTGVGCLVLPFFTSSKDNIGDMVRKITYEERKIFLELHRLIAEFKSCNKWDLVARDYNKKYGDKLIICQMYGTPMREHYHLNILIGIFKRLGLQHP